TRPVFPANPAGGAAPFRARPSDACASTWSVAFDSPDMERSRSRQATARPNVVRKIMGSIERARETDIAITPEKGHTSACETPPAPRLAHAAGWSCPDHAALRAIASA